eukprot:UN1187
MMAARRDSWTAKIVGSCPDPVTLSSLVHELRDRLPTDREQGSLDAVGEDARAQTAAEEPCIAVLLDDQLCRLEVADGLERRLPGRLEHAQGVGATVRHRGGGETDERVADVLPECEVEGGQDLAELVVGVEPRVVADPSGGHGADCSLPESSGVLLRLLDEALQAVLALHLLRGLPRVNRHQEHAEPGCAARCYFE